MSIASGISETLQLFASTFRVFRAFRGYSLRGRI